MDVIGGGKIAADYRHFDVSLWDLSSVSARLRIATVAACGITASKDVNGHTRFV